MIPFSRHAAAAALVTALGMAAAPAHAAWTLAPLAGNSIGAMYPFAINDGGGVTASLNPSGNKPSMYAYGTTSTIKVLWLCGGSAAGPNATVPYAVDATGFYNVGSCFPNSAGTIWGFYYATGGSVSAIAYPGASSTFPRGVASGTVAGSYFTSNTVGHGFLYNVANNVYTSIDAPGATFTEVDGMGRGGTVFGFYSGGGTDHGFLYNGSFTYLNPPGYVTAYPAAVSGSNQAAGIAIDSTGYAHAFSWKNGAFDVFQAPFALNAYATSITSDGRIAGYVQTTANTYYGFVWSPSLGQASYFVPPGGTTYMQVSGINDWGQVSGYYQKATGSTAFVATCTGSSCVP